MPKRRWRYVCGACEWVGYSRSAKRRHSRQHWRHDLMAPFIKGTPAGPPTDEDYAAAVAENELRRYAETEAWRAWRFSDIPD